MKRTFMVLFAFNLFHATLYLFAQESELVFAENLGKLSVTLYQQGKYKEAIPLAIRALTIEEKILGAEHPKVAISLDNLALLYKKMGAYIKAESLYQRALTIFEKDLGPEHLDVATNLNNQASLYFEMDYYSKAEPLYRRALAIYEENLGSTHPSVAISMDNLASLYHAMGSFSKAESLHQRSLKILEQTLGSNHPDVALSLNNLAALYVSQSNFAIAEQFFQRAMKIYEEAFGLAHPNIAICLNHLGDLYQVQGNFTKSVQFYQRALKTSEKALGPDHPDVATSLNALARLYIEQGNYTKSELLYQQAFKISVHALGPDDPEVAISLNGLAGLYHTKGNYSKAEQLYQQVLKINAQKLGPDHPRVAADLNNLAALNQDKGNYYAAEGFSQRALEIIEQAYGPNHPNVAVILNNLADAYKGQAHYTKVESLSLRALKIREQMLGQDHREVAISLNNLADLYQAQGDYAKAEPLCRRALKIWKQALGPNHPNIAIGLNNLAGLYQAQGNYTKAEPLYQQAFKIGEQALGPNHPRVAASLNSLACTEMALDRLHLAKQHFQMAANIETAFMKNLFVYSTEIEKLFFLKTLVGRLDMFINFVTQKLSPDTATVKAALNLVLQRKAIVFEASSQQQQIYNTFRDSVAQQLFQRFKALSHQIAHLMFTGPRDSAFTVYRQKLNKLVAERDLLVEKSLAQYSGTFLHERQGRQQVKVEQVADFLSKGSTLIEFVRYREFNFKTKEYQYQWGAARYAVFLLTVTKAGEVYMNDLGPTQPIDSLLRVYHQEMKMANNLGTLSKLRKDAEGRLNKIAHQLYRHLFAPIKAALPDSGILHCAPDGPLHLLPFEILVDDAGKYLVERYQFNYLGSGRDLLRFAKVSQGDNMYVFADATFDAKPPLQAASKEPLLASSELVLASENVRRSHDWRGGKLEPLPGTAAEASTIQTLLQLGKNQIFVGSRATEENLFSLKSPWRLHIATHGFFLKDQEEVKQLTRPEMFMTTFDEQRFGLGQFENPLLRSGLALAGANTIGQQHDSTQAYDGITTAYEISGMNLQGTDLVVLSACETGLGEVQNGEGVFGLRRAFQLAGAQTVVLSLWKVPDNETKELMIDFYTRLKNGEGKSQALRHAELAMMRKQREQYGSAHPYFRGAFICAGNPE